MIGTDFSHEVQVSAAVSQIGKLPDAPLAMPKQRLDRAVPPGRGVLIALLRPFFARAGRSEG